MHEEIEKLKDLVSKELKNGKLENASEKLSLAMYFYKKQMNYNCCQLARALHLKNHRQVLWPIKKAETVLQKHPEKRFKEVTPALPRIRNIEPIIEITSPKGYIIKLTHIQAAADLLTALDNRYASI